MFWLQEEKNITKNVLLRLWPKGPLYGYGHYGKEESLWSEGRGNEMVGWKGGRDDAQYMWNARVES